MSMGVLHAVCVVAAAVMVLQSRTTRTRVAHVVMLLAMVAVALAGTALVLAASAAALVATGLWLLGGRRRADVASCGLDLVANASLVALMGVATVWGDHDHGAGSHPMPGMADGSHPLVGLVVPALAGTVVLTWAVVRARVDRGEGGTGAALAAWSMVLVMGAMSFA
ncbi:hypothetical protein [Solicola sp. PLA-1-18]|uniref:hypothetical protein n=1 Tax=Solicola sp. PLA-1-18 TaxID=3380532 RepID=UPI003B7B5954